MNPHPDPHSDFFLDPHPHFFDADPQHYFSPQITSAKFFSYFFWGVQASGCITYKLTEYVDELYTLETKSIQG
jgi:hypothetical protein